MLGELLRRFATELARTALQRGLVALRERADREEHSMPLSYKHVEHNRRLERSALELSRQRMRACVDCPLAGFGGCGAVIEGVKLPPCAVRVRFLRLLMTKKEREVG